MERKTRTFRGTRAASAGAAALTAAATAAAQPATNLRPTLLRSVQGAAETFDPAADARIDPNAAISPFGGVPSLFVHGRLATGVAVSPRHVLTAAHTFDLDNDGVLDKGSDVALFFHHDGDLSHVVTPSDVDSVNLHPDFTGFGNPGVRNDLAIITLKRPLPENTPTYQPLDRPLDRGEVIWMVGYGESGDGERGPISGTASFTVKRIGANAADELYARPAAEPDVWGFDFDGPAAENHMGGAGLGPEIETTLGPGDSGGPGFVWDDGDLRLASVNTFVCGPGHPGRYGSGGGGVIVRAQWWWIGAFLAGPSSGDVTGDGVIDRSDLAAVLSAWGEASEQNDVNADGVIDRRDLARVMENWTPRR